MIEKVPVANLQNRYRRYTPTPPTLARTGMTVHRLEYGVVFLRTQDIPRLAYPDQDEEMDNVPALRRKLQRVQVSNLNLTRELERAERMLKAQVFRA